MKQYFTKQGYFAFFLFSCFLYSSLVYAQSRNVSGTVTSDEDGEAVPGVNILLKGTATGTITDVDGNYSLSVPSDESILVFSAVGFLTEEITVGPRTTVDVVLELDIATLGEIVVVGYGEQSREKLTSSVSKLDTKVLENVQFGNAATAMQGTVSGVRVQQTTGQPGASPRVIMRGGASINDPNGAQPLYIVDGVQRLDLNGINTSNIESMQVLKDAAATAIYGARAANGVVIVETKSGVEGQTQVTYKTSLGIAQLREKFPVLNARDYIYYHRIGAAASAAAQDGIYNPGDNYQQYASENDFGGDAQPWGTGNDLTNETFYTTQYLTPENEYKLNEGWETLEDPLFPSRTIIFKGTDWQDVLFRTGFTQDHNVSVTGGSDKATFRLGAGYMDQDGVAIMTDYQRFTGDLDGRIQFTDNIAFFAGLNYSQERDNEVFSNNALFERSITTAPTTKYYFEDGTMAPGTTQSLGNPEYHMSRYQNDNKRNYLTLRGGVEIDILPGLSFKPAASLFVRNIEEHEFLMSYNNGTRGGIITDRPASAYDATWEQKEFDGVLNYQKEFNNSHNLDITAGFSYFDRDNTIIDASGRRAATDKIPTLNASAEPVSVFSSMSEQKIIGYFGRINYDYKLRYLLTFTSRYDGATNLGEEYKWGFFPAISGGWNVHNEDFWNNPARINRLKFRVSYGTSGNLGNLSDYQAQGEYSVGGSYNGEAAIEYSELANQNLQWEESTTFDVGIDAGLFNNRIAIIFDYYRRVTDNLITTLSLPASTGFSNILTNLGTLENRGVELELSANIINTNNFTWNVSLNAARNENEILDLPENQNENNRVGGFYVYDTELGDYTWKGGLQEGGKMGDMFAYEQTGVFATQEEADAGPLNTMRLRFGPENYAGDAGFLDTDGNGMIEPTDRVYQGNEFPVWTGGVSTTVSYKGLSLYVRMDYATGHTIMNYVRASTNGVYAGGLNSTTDLMNAWQSPGDQTDMPKFYMTDQIIRGNTWMGDSRRNGGGNSFYFEKGNYLALREISLSYMPPESLYHAVGFLKSLRVNLAANNLGYVTNYFGLNPEEGGWDRGRYPLPRQITLGLNVTF